SESGETYAGGDGSGARPGCQEDDDDRGRDLHRRQVAVRPIDGQQPVGDVQPDYAQGEDRVGEVVEDPRPDGAPSGQVAHGLRRSRRPRSTPRGPGGLPRPATPVTLRPAGTGATPSRRCGGRTPLVRWPIGSRPWWTR